MNVHLRVLVVVALFAATPLPALAHAYLVETVPAAGATLAVAPDAARLTFDEPVTLVSPDDVRVAAPNGDVVGCAGGAAVDPHDAAAVVCRFGTLLRGGSYTVAWQVVSADSHVVAGSYGFGVRAAGAAARARRSAYDPDAPFAVLLRWLQLLGITAFAGVPVFALVVVDVDDRAARRHLRRVAVAGAAVAVAAALGALVVQLLSASGGAGIGRVVLPLLCTTWGMAWCLRLALLALALAVTRAWRPAVSVWCGGLALLTLAASGHALEPAAPAVRALLLVADTAHAAAAAVWLGGVAGFAAVPRLAVTERLARFSPVALAAVGVLVAAGLVGAIAHVPSFGALAASSYGRWLLLKAVLLLPVLALGFVHLQTGRGVRGGGATLTAARAETGLLILLFLLSATLAGTAPPVHAGAASP